MKKNKIIAGALYALFISGIISCTKEDDNNTGGSFPVISGKGVFVINEGNFGSSDGSVSFYDPVSNKINNDVFKQVNKRPLGDVVQSMNIIGSTAYIVVNNSRTVEAADVNYFTSKGTITGFAGPRFLLPVSADKAYVSDWFDNNIKIISFSAMTITGSIPAGSGPEQMTLSSGKVFVTNVGGYDRDSTVTVIDIKTDSVIATIATGLNPNSIVTDANGKVWVLCNGWYGLDNIGGTADDVEGKLIRINPLTNQIEAEFTMKQFDHPLRLTMNRQKNELYYLVGVSGFTGSVYRFSIAGTSLPLSPVINKDLYGLGIHPEGDIYGGFSPSFGQAGYMFRYENNGTLKDSTRVGTGPNGFVFK